MANYDHEQVPIDAVRRDLARGLMLQVAGWTLLTFLGVIVIFIWTGLRAGSYFWLYWTLIQSVIGLALVMAGNHNKEKAGGEIPRTREEEKAA